MYISPHKVDYSSDRLSHITSITLKENQQIESNLIKQIFHHNNCENSIEIFEDLLQSFLDVNDNNIDKLVNISNFHINDIIEDQAPAISLLQISIYAKRYDYANIILKKGGNPDIQMLDGSTALHIATNSQQENFVSLLLSYNASTIIYNNSGLLPIHIAYDNINIIKLLVGQNTNDINLPNKEGSTLLHIICSQSIDVEKQKKIVEILLDREDIKVNCKTTKGSTPLHFSSAINSEITSMLLKNGAMVNVKTDISITPLMIACNIKNNDENVKLLLQNQADVRIRETSLGWQAIHFASYNGSANTIDLLLEYGADVNSKTPIFKGGVTPLILALKYEHNSLAEHLLADKGADINVRGTDDIVGCFNLKNAENKQCGVFPTITCTLFCGWSVPFFPIFEECSTDSIKKIWRSTSYARNTMFPCLHPTAKSFITDAGLLARVDSVKNKVVTEEPKTTLQLLKDKLTNNLFSYIPLPHEDDKSFN